jgi:hypothetical protein
MTIGLTMAVMLAHDRVEQNDRKANEKALWAADSGLAQKVNLVIRFKQRSSTAKALLSPARMCVSNEATSTQHHEGTHHLETRYRARVVQLATGRSA